MDETDRRTDQRLPVEHGTVVIGDQTYPLKNWSTRGFLASSYTGDHKEGDRISVRFSVLFVERQLEFSGEARVIRVDAERQELAGLLVLMGEEWNDAFSRYFGKAGNRG
jgi:hypothetical protein